MTIRAIQLVMVLAALAAWGSFARAQAPGRAPNSPEVIGDTPNVLPPQARGLDVEEHVGRQVPMELSFRRYDGKSVRLAEYFQGSRPAVVLLVYYKCPIVCDVVMGKAVESLGGVEYRAGIDYDLLVFSFDPTEGASEAAAARQTYLASYGRELPLDRGFEFHAGDSDSARALAEALGFKYRRMSDGNYSHPVAKFIVTPEGKVSRYLYGYSQDPKDVKLALMEASQGKLVRTIGERLQNYCYMFNAAQGKYTLRAMRVMQIGALLTLGALSVLVAGLLAGEWVRKRRAGGLKGVAGVVTAPTG